MNKKSLTNNMGEVLARKSRQLDHNPALGIEGKLFGSLYKELYEPLEDKLYIKLYLQLYPDYSWTN